MRLLAIFLMLVAHLCAEDDFAYSDTPSVSKNILYSSYASLPKTLYQGELFSITLKTLSTETHFKEIRYRFENMSGVRQISDYPEESREGPYYLHRFYFVATDKNVRTPDITLTLVYSDFHKSDLAWLPGKNVEVITLNPPKHFASVIATSMQVQEYKTNHYDDGHNVVVFSAEATGGVLDSFQIPDIMRQGFESNTSSSSYARMTYYAIAPKSLEALTFSYFNTRKQAFEKLLIPIIVEDDSVSTQSDLKPRDHRHTEIKLYIAIGIGVLALLLFISRKKGLYLLIVALSASYSAFVLMPLKEVCVKQGSEIYLLPMKNSTVFKRLEHDQQFLIEGHARKYMKIRLDEQMIGWVHNEARCTP